MGSIDTIKQMSTVLSSAVNKSKQHQEKFLGDAENQTQTGIGAFCSLHFKRRYAATRYYKLMQAKNRCDIGGEQAFFNNRISRGTANFASRKKET